MLPPRSLDQSCPKSPCRWKPCATIALPVLSLTSNRFPRPVTWPRCAPRYPPAPGFERHAFCPRRAAARRVASTRFRAGQVRDRRRSLRTLAASSIATRIIRSSDDRVRAPVPVVYSASPAITRLRWPLRHARLSRSFGIPASVARQVKSYAS